MRLTVSDRHVNSYGIILCLEVRELRTLYVYIHICAEFKNFA